MRRRKFITLLSGAVAAWPLAGRAQQPERVRRIGALLGWSADDPESLVIVGAFSQGLQELGWKLGSNVRIDYRWAAVDEERIRQYAVDLVATAPDVLLASGNTIVRALQIATTTLPIVFVNVGDPVGSGLVAKMINQLIVGCGHAVMAEALLLAESAGIDAARIPECLGGGHADGTLLQKLYPRMARRDFAPQGYARQLLKDLEMVHAFAGGLKAPVPMAGEALSLYRMLVHLGHSELDAVALFKLYEKEQRK